MAEQKMKKVWDNCQEIGEVVKSPGKKLRVELVARDGVKYINIREWYKRKRDNEWRPGITGFAVPIALPMDETVERPAEDFFKLIASALPAAKNFELEDEENAVWVEKKK